MRFRIGSVFFAASLAIVAQLPAQSAALEHDKPLPDLVTMMQKVIQNERVSEAMQQDYLVHEKSSSAESFGRSWQSDKNPHDRGSYWHSIGEEDRESEVFWLNGVRVSRLLAVSGFTQKHHRYGHTLSPDELHRENARIDAELADVAKARDAGDIQGERNATGILNEIRLSRFLELGTFSNRREGDGRRNDIAVDYNGKACAAECTPLDSAAQYVRGTLSIDAEDLAVTEFKGTFTETWVEPGDRGRKVIKGSELEYFADRREGGVWFPAIMGIFTTVSRGNTLHSSSVYFFFKDYRKFKVTSTILPDLALVPEEAVPDAPPTNRGPR